VSGWWAASYGVLWALVIMLSVVVVALARQIGTLHLRLGPRGALEVDTEGPVLGEAAPVVEATDVSGRSVSLGEAGAAQLLMFVSPGCKVCGQVLPALSSVAGTHDLVPYVVADADEEETSRTYDGERTGAVLIPGEQAARSYAIPGTPYVVVTDDVGVVRAKGTVNNLEQVEGLADAALHRARVAARERQAS